MLADITPAQPSAPLAAERTSVAPVAAPPPKTPAPQVVEPQPTPTPAPKPKPKPKPKPTVKPQPSAKPQPKTILPQQAARAPRAQPSAPAAKPAPETQRGGRSGGLSKTAKNAAEQAYLAALQRAISRQQRYPTSAKRRQQSGVVTLSFVIQADGKISQTRIARGSGHQALDQAALDALYRLGRFKPLPSAIGRRTWSLQVPIRFDLQ